MIVTKKRSAIAWLADIGVPQKFTVALDVAKPNASHVRYLDLVGVQSATPDAVVESNGYPVLYVVHQDSLGERANAVELDARLSDLLWTLACRADARYLAVIRPGVVAIYPIHLSPTVGKSVELPEETAGSQLRDFLTGGTEVLGSKLEPAKIADNQWLDEFMFRLLMVAAERLKVECGNLSNGDILSLVGRALFARFLADREIFCDADVTKISTHAATANHIFVDSRSAASTFRWLDNTFNGDLLPLSTTNYKKFFELQGLENSSQICGILTDIMLRAVGGQMVMDWRAIRFRHVPVDLLSQVYERFFHAFESPQAKRTSVHYTPRHIAQYLLDGTFYALGESERSTARVLDPAVGGGVFLVLALRRLVRERWQRSGRRPDRRVIRSILNKQLCGFDINPESLKFTALSLYLTALELDPQPTPLDDLRFDDLQGVVLHNVSQERLGDAADRTLGSLSDAVKQVLPKGQTFNNFDVVISNPPWTALTRAGEGKSLTQIVRRIAADVGIAPDRLSDYKNPDSVPDVPFIWKSLEWVKPAGAIGFAVHARLLFRQTDEGKARALLFDAVRFTGVVNAAALRMESNIWPRVSAPFCLLVGRNERPTAEDGFYFVSPNRETTLNDLGQFRIDPEAAVPILNRYVKEQPFLFKALFRGNALDREILARIHERKSVPLCEIDEVRHGEGYQPANGTKQAAYLENQPTLNETALQGRVVDPSALPKIPAGMRFYRPKDADIYRGPLVLFRQAPKFERDERGALICDFDVAYKRSYVGYSFARLLPSDCAHLYADYVFVLSYSNLFLYYSLLTSSQFGVERDALLKEDIDRFPVIRYEVLTATQKHAIQECASMLRTSVVNWHLLDTVVADIYGLNEIDGLVVADTLATQLTHRHAQDWAQSAPTSIAIGEFVSYVQKILSPWCVRTGKRVVIERVATLDSASWRYLSIGMSDASASKSDDFIALLGTQLADRFWASKVVMHQSDGQLIVGFLAQNRYWTRTRAKLLALDLLQSEPSFKVKQKRA